ncbi:MAG: hypothetical protein VYA21_06315 [Verrucomicrobiota bacterium]|nr:hypothetical protein [Verrucomicrobiota bacterium]
MLSLPSTIFSALPSVASAGMLPSPDSTNWRIPSLNASPGSAIDASAAFSLVTARPATPVCADA